MLSCIYRAIFTEQEALTEVEVLEEGIKEINNLIHKMAVYFCEDEKKIKLQEVLGLFKTFCDQLTTAKKVRSSEHKSISLTLLSC